MDIYIKSMNSNKLNEVDYNLSQYKLTSQQKMQVRKTLQVQLQNGLFVRIL